MFLGRLIRHRAPSSLPNRLSHLRNRHSQQHLVRPSVQFSAQILECNARAKLSRADPLLKAKPQPSQVINRGASFSPNLHQSTSQPQVRPEVNRKQRLQALLQLPPTTLKAPGWQWTAPSRRGSRSSPRAPRHTSALLGT